MSDRDVGTMSAEDLREQANEVGYDERHCLTDAALEALDELARRASARPSVPASAVLDRKVFSVFQSRDGGWKVDLGGMSSESVHIVRADAITVDHEPATPPSEGADDEDFPSIRKNDYDEQEGR